MSGAPVMRPVRLAVVLEQEIHQGGGYQQSVNAARLVMRLPRDLAEPVFLTLHEGNLAALERHGIRASHLRVSAAARVLARVEHEWPNLHGPCRTLAGGAALEAQLSRRGIDLVYFLSPSLLARHLDTLNYITTVWDLCHRDEPEFPEVRRGREFEQRESVYHSILPRATAVLVDSEAGRYNVVRRYGVDAWRTHVIPFSPAAAQDISDEAYQAGFFDVKERYGLAGDYVFYPAQFWPHKNHVYLLEGLQRLEQLHGHRLGAVFSGGDKGNLAFVKAKAEKLGLADRVRFAGFVPDGQMPYFYRQSVALVMPTYFGPTNLPPLEAFANSVPVLYPDKPGLREQVGDAALLMDLRRPDSMARHLADLMASPGLRARLVAAGHAKLARHSDEDRLATLRAIVEDFRRRRAAWR